MAKKAELLEQAKKLKLDVTIKNTIAEIESAIASAEIKTEKAEGVVENKKSTTAKSGKRSAKAIKEVEEKEAKEHRKEVGDTTPQSEEAATKTSESTKGPRPITRPRLDRRGKKYREVAKLIDKTKVYSLNEAIETILKTNPSKFDASIEIHVRLFVDPRQADQNIRANVVLPHGTGKTVRVAVFAPESEHIVAKKAGADIVGDEELLSKLDKGVIDFDVLVTTPQYMPKLSKYARSLGPKGLMPNPKSGTVSTDLAKAVTEAKAGKVEYRVDKQSIIHLSIGKISFGTSKLIDNANAFVASLKSQKPNSIKGAFVHSTSMSTTQGPSIKVENIS